MTRAADTNQAESFFSRLRRAEIGQHRRIGVHLHQYAGEMAWREDNRRKATGTQFMNFAGAALGHPVSRNWCGVLAAVGFLLRSLPLPYTKWAYRVLTLPSGGPSRHEEPPWYGSD